MDTRYPMIMLIWNIGLAYNFKNSNCLQNLSFLLVPRQKCYANNITSSATKLSRQETMIDPFKNYSKLILLALVNIFLCSALAKAQTIGQNILSQLLETAEKNYPSIQAAKAEQQASVERVKASKRTFIPNLNASAQANYATYNNLTGMVLPQYIVPVTGPPSEENLNTMVWGTAAGLLLEWEPITFGKRNKEIQYAQSISDQKKAAYEHTLFEHKVKVIDAYLDYLLSQQLLEVQEKNLARAEANYKQSVSLARNGLRPGVDTAQFQTELANTKIQRLQQKNQVMNAKVNLEELLADTLSDARATDYFFENLPVGGIPPRDINRDTGSHPLEVLAQKDLASSIFNYQIAKRAWLPELSLWGTAYGRGSGVNSNGEVSQATDGLQLSRYNYGLGIQLAIPLTSVLQWQPEWKAREFQVQAKKHALGEVTLQLKSQQAVAENTLNTALEITTQTPLQYEAATFSYNAMQSRYQAGLVTFADLAQAQYALTNAETDFRLSYWETWKSLLYKAAVYGDLNIILNQVEE